MTYRCAENSCTILTAWEMTLDGKRLYYGNTLHADPRHDETKTAAVALPFCDPTLLSHAGCGAVARRVILRPTIVATIDPMSRQLPRKIRPAWNPPAWS